MSFSFGTPTTNAGLGGAASTPATGGFSFGAQPPTNAQLPAFGSATSASNPASAAAAPSLNFSPAATPSFGSPAASATALTTGAVPTFGAPSAVPAFGSGAGSIAPTPSFGSPAASATALTTGAVPTFGAPSAVPAFGSGAGSIAPTFGAGSATVTPNFRASVPSTAPTIGAGLASTAPTFGAAAATGAPAATVRPMFGAGATTTAPTFGGTGTTPAFGAAATTSTFGAPAFGTGTTATAPAFAAPTATPAFGAAPATTTVAPNFKIPAANTNAPTTAPPAFGTTAQTSGATFSFNKPAATSAATLNFNTTTSTATAQPFNTNLSLGGNTIGSTATAGGVLGKPLTTGAAPTFLGLGGIDVSATQPKLGDIKQDGVKIRETQVPDEIVKTVNAFKNYIKEQKTISSEIGRTSTSKLTNVSHAITDLRWTLQNVANSVDTNNRDIKQLRSETAKAMQSLEMAQRTHDTPAGLQFENHAPFQYFQCLVAKYEDELIAFRKQILATESHMHTLANPQNISPDDLKRGLRQLNESFISLAGRLHELNQRVEEQKEQYLGLRRYHLRDATNVFAAIDNPAASVGEPQRISSGPTPFSLISAMSSLNKTYASASASNTNSK